MGLKEAESTLLLAEAADVVEARKGRWANGAFGYGHYWCTVCQKEVRSEEEKTNFCPNCGAKMAEV